MNIDFHPSSSLELPDRERHIVTLVARFQQLTSKHIQMLLFHDVGRTPVDRALRRLTDRGYLIPAVRLGRQTQHIRIERRLVGGARGGSGQYVYALGRRGF